MLARNPNFPKKLLRQFLLRSTLLFVICFGLLFIVYKKFFLSDLEKAFPYAEWQSFLIVNFLLMIGCALILFSGMLAFVYFELLIPLGTVYTRLKAIKEQREEASERDLAQDEPGEWSDLEMVIVEIRERLQKSHKRGLRDKVTLATLMDAIPEAILALDHEYRPIFYNTSLLNLFNLNEETVQTFRLSEQFRLPQILSSFEVTLRSQRICRTQITIASDGIAMPKVLQVTFAPLKGLELDKMYGVVCIFQDVTELKQLEQIRIDFVANVSHEFRTPLTSMKGYTQTLLDDFKNKRFKTNEENSEKYLEIINRNVDRLLFLVNDLLDLSSLDSGIQIECEDIETEQITQIVLHQLEGMKQKKEIEVLTSYEAKTVWADSGRVQQVLINLLQNAYQYVPSGSKIWIAWRITNNGTELLVQDNGPGIATDQLNRIFERFYRVDKSRTRDTGGTGLGLSIVKHIMQRHGGIVKVESHVGVGTTFICHFPIRTLS